MATRGNKNNVDKFINDLLAQKYFYGEPAPDGKRHILGLRVEPIQLWSLVCQKEHFEEVLATMLPGFNNTKDVHPVTKHLEKLRFILKAKKLPKMDLTNHTRRMIDNNGVSVYPFAIKEDQIWTDAPTETLDNGQPIPKELIGHERL